jgi:sugar lactone lactonase YvrE
MPVFKPIISLPGYGPGDGLEFFESTDIYRWDVDNRPLENLASNDIAIKDAVDQLVDEIELAYSGRFWPDGTEYTWTGLDPRLDNMDQFLQNFFEVRNVQFSSFMQAAMFLRERYTSGFMNGPFPDKFIRSNFSSENNEFMPSPFGGFYVPENSRTVRDQDVPDHDAADLVAIETRIEQDGENPYLATSWRAQRKPLYALVNGFVVPLFNAHGGMGGIGTSPTQKDTIGRRAAGNYGPITIQFPRAEPDRQRFDFAFLEVWLQEIPASAPYFFPYGSRDWSQWSGKSNVFAGPVDGATALFDGQTTARELIPIDQVGWGATVIQVDSASETIDWDTHPQDAVDNGSGALVGPNCNGTINYATGEFSIEYDAGFEPPAGKYLRLHVRGRAIPDATDPTVQGTLTFLPNGNYLQIQSAIRVVPDVDYESYPDFFSDPQVLARAGNEEAHPTGLANYEYHNAENEFNDGTLYYAGDGSSAAKSDLNTLDGRVYAIPLGCWARMSESTWTPTNQHGGVARPDGWWHRHARDENWLDLRPCVFNERYDMRAAAEQTLDRIIRGAHKTIFAQAWTDHNDDGTWQSWGYWGTEVSELWRIYQYAGLPPEEPYNTVRDIGLATSKDPSDFGASYPDPKFDAPVAHHDGIRQLFSPQEEVQDVALTITDVTNSDDANPAPLVSYARTTRTITINTNQTSLSGYAPGANGVLINDTYPRLWWRGSRQPVIYSTKWQGLGSKTATAVIDETAVTYEPNGTIDGYIELLYPESTGIGRPVNKVISVEFTDGVNTYKTIQEGNADGSPSNQEDAAWHIQSENKWKNVVFNQPTGLCLTPANDRLYVCDSGDSRIMRLKLSLTIDNLSGVSDDGTAYQWPLLSNYPFDPSSYNPAIHLRYPIACATDPNDGSVYVVDREAHRVIKLDATLENLLASFGVDSTPANDPYSTTHLRSPEGVAVDSNGNVYVADSEQYRVVKLNSSLSYISQYGTGINGTGEGQLSQPSGLAVGSVGGVEYLFIADQSRLVTLKTVDMTLDSILGSPTTAEMQKFFRNVNGGVTSMDEDAAGNKYVQWNARKQVLKFDPGWALIATFGNDTISGFDTEHLYWPLDIVYDPDADLVYVADGNNGGGTGFDAPARIVVLDGTTLEFVDHWMVPNADAGEGTGLHLIQDAGSSAKLYLTAHKRIYKLALPIPGSRGDTSLWSTDWTINGINGENCLRVHDIAGAADDSVLYSSDFFRGKVYKLNPSNGAYLGDIQLFDPWPPGADGGFGGPYGMEMSPDESQVYVFGGSLVTGAAAAHPNSMHVLNAGTLAYVTSYRDSKNWDSETSVFNLKYNVARDKAYLLMFDTGILIYEMPLTPVGNSITDNFIKNLADVPFTDELELAVEWEDARDLDFENDIIYVTDPETNTITAVDAVSMRVLGQVGSPSVVGKGEASWSGVAGVAQRGNWIFFSDTYNNRVLRTFKYAPNVERGTGRVTYLLAPPSDWTCTMLVNYTPYQGRWKDIDEPAIYGRNFVVDNNQVYITTMGRGTPSTITQEGGMGFYANMIEHLPTPSDTPTKSPRVGDEYIFSPNPIPITSESTGTPFVQLPVINRYPASAQEIYPVYGGGSRYDFNRILFMQGPGPNWPDTTPGDWIGRGFDGSGTFPGFDIIETFPMKTLSVPRLIFCTAVIELQGKAYLAIYSTYQAHAENKIGDGSVTVDLFRLFGNPGLKPRY